MLSKGRFRTMKSVKNKVWKETRVIHLLKIKVISVLIDDEVKFKLKFDFSF